MEGLFNNQIGSNENDFSDLIFQSPDLTDADRQMAQSILDKNLVNIIKEKKKSHDLFASLAESEAVEKVNFAIKAFLQHQINKRGV